MCVRLVYVCRGGRRYRNVVWQVEEQIALELIIHNRIQTARSVFQITHAKRAHNGKSYTHRTSNFLFAQLEFAEGACAGAHVHLVR